MVYEVVTFQALREHLRCKEIWIDGADRWRNPDDDLPRDFETRRTEHYASLRKPVDPAAFIAGLREEMHAELDALHGIPVAMKKNPTDMGLTCEDVPGWVPLGGAVCYLMPILRWYRVSYGAGREPWMGLLATGLDDRVELLVLPFLSRCLRCSGPLRKGDT